MTDKKLVDAIENSVRQDVKDSGDINTGSFMLLVGGAGNLVSPWWSRTRDAELRSLLKKSDHLSGAMYNFATKIAAIPLNIVPKDMSMRTHLSMAADYTEYIQNYTEFGAGWEQFISKWVEDYHSQDNGAFIEFIADGDKDKPISGMIYSMAILDASKCTRTSSAEFPVVYTDDNGLKYKLHYTRVAAISQSPSPSQHMNNVGFCAVSRAINAAQNLLDIAIYKQERLGSRPSTGILLTGGGLDPDDLELAMSSSDMRDTEQSMARYSSYTVVGNKNFVEPKLEQIRLNDAPPWFDERESTILGMAVIAMAFGMDARELFPALEAGATKADAIISHIKQRGKGPGHVLRIIERTLNTRFLPSFLRAEFDFQDDAEDRQRAEILSVRSYSRVRRMSTKVTNVRVEREIMLSDKEITQEQFEELELYDGRLETGVTVDVLFYSDDKDYKNWLGGANESNYEDKKIELMKFIVSSRDAERIRKARRAIAALEYRFEKKEEEEEEEEEEIDTSNSMRNEDGMPRENYEEERISTKLPVSVTNAPDETQDIGGDNSSGSTDEG